MLILVFVGQKANIIKAALCLQNRFCLANVLFMFIYLDFYETGLQEYDLTYSDTDSGSLSCTDSLNQTG